MLGMWKENTERPPGELGTGGAGGFMVGPSDPGEGLVRMRGIWAG